MDFTRISSTMRLVLLLILHTWSYTYVSTTNSTTASTSNTITETSTKITSLPSTTGTTHDVTHEDGSSSSASSLSSSQSTTSSATADQTTTTAPPSTSTLSVTSLTTAAITPPNTTTLSVTTHTVTTTTLPSITTSLVTVNANTTSTTDGVTTSQPTTTVSTLLHSTTPIITTGDTTVTSSQPTTTVSTLLQSTTTIITTTDINECNNTHACDVNAYCNNTVGSYNCICKKGYEGDGFNCTDINECNNTHACDVNAYCNNTVGSYNCTCKNSYEGDGFNCTDINECNNTHACDVNAYCNNTVGSYNCTCKKGYEGDGFNCTDFNECNHNDTNSCHAHADCHNTNGSYICSCKDGFDGDGFNCTDKDECKNKTLCDFTEYCVNTIGNYSCKCKPGYYKDEKIDQCVQARYSYVGYVTVATNNTNLTVLTEALQNWLNNTVFKTLSGLAYTEILIDGIAYTNRRPRREAPAIKNITYIIYLNKETTREYMENLTQQYLSSNLSEFHVVDLDIAQDFALCVVIGECDPFSTVCEAANGRYECTCKKGFIPRTNPFSEKFCIDENECDLDHSKCKEGGTCVNIPGSWSCNCTNGYVEDPSGQQCIDVCQTNPCKNNARCERGNRPGLYYCKCTPDWKGHDCTEAQDNSEASKFRTILIAVGASLGSICFLLLIVTCRLCRRNQSKKHPELRPLSTHMNDYEMDEKKGTYQMPRAHVYNDVDPPSKMEDKQSTYHIPRAQLSNTNDRHYDEIEGGRELNVLDERSSKEDKLERQPLTKSMKEAHGGAENRSFLHDEAERRRSQNPGKSGVDYF